MVALLLLPPCRADLPGFSTASTTIGGSQEAEFQTPKGQRDTDSGQRPWQTNGREGAARTHAGVAVWAAPGVGGGMIPTIEAYRPGWNAQV